MFEISPSRNPNVIGQLVSHDHLLGRWRLTLELFGRVFCDDVGAEPGSVISELGGFPVKESKFRREMEKLRNTQQRDLTLDVSITFSRFDVQYQFRLYLPKTYSCEYCCKSYFVLCSILSYNRLKLVHMLQLTSLFGVGGKRPSKSAGGRTEATKPTV